MNRILWRIASDTPAYTADDLSGAGAKATGGRWNAVDVPVVYTSTNRSLACLETLVHFNAGGLPLNRYLVAIDVPEPVWATAEIATVQTLNIGWDAEPAGRESLAFGTSWLRSRRSALLRIPSVIVHEEENVLVNPVHPDAKRLTARKVRKWLYDPRLVR